MSCTGSNKSFRFLVRVRFVALGFIFEVALTLFLWTTLIHSVFQCLLSLWIAMVQCFPPTTSQGLASTTAFVPQSNPTVLRTKTLHMTRKTKPSPRGAGSRQQMDATQEVSCYKGEVPSFKVCQERNISYTYFVGLHETYSGMWTGIKNSIVSSGNMDPI